jgi:peroxiredoxin
MSVATRPPAPTVGSPAPDVTLRDAAGTPVGLAELWTSAPRALVLVFVRHFG